MFCWFVSVTYMDMTHVTDSLDVVKMDGRMFKCSA